MSAARKTDSSGSSVTSGSSDSPDASTPDEGIHKCDTVPPPDGEDSAYDAPTKVGELGLVQQLMAQAEGMVGRVDTAPPPQSGERPLAARKALPGDPPVHVSPPPATIPRVYSAEDDDGNDGDRLDPTSLLGQPQSGETKLLEVNAAPAMEAIAPPPPSASMSPSAPLAVASSAPPVGSETIAAQLDAYRVSTRPGRDSSDAKLVFVACVLVTLGIAALYFFFLAA